METGFENPTLRISLFCTLASFQASLNFPKNLPLSNDWCISGDSAELVSSHYPAVQCLWFSLMVVPFDRSLLAPNLLAMCKKNGACSWDGTPCKLCRLADSKGGFPAGSAIPSVSPWLQWMYFVHFSPNQGRSFLDMAMFPAAFPPWSSLPFFVRLNFVLHLGCISWDKVQLW